MSGQGQDFYEYRDAAQRDAKAGRVACVLCELTSPDVDVVVRLMDATCALEIENLRPVCTACEPPLPPGLTASPELKPRRRSRKKKPPFVKPPRPSRQRLAQDALEEVAHALPDDKLSWVKERLPNLFKEITETLSAKVEAAWQTGGDREFDIALRNLLSAVSVASGAYDAAHYKRHRPARRTWPQFFGRSANPNNKKQRGEAI